MRTRLLRGVGTLMCRLLQQHTPKVFAHQGTAGAWHSMLVCHRCAQPLSTIPTADVVLTPVAPGPMRKSA
jgi:hypothetical protein